MTTPKIGLQFYHSRVLAKDMSGLQLYQVTRIAWGCVYYRPVYTDGTIGRSAYCDAGRFNEICLRVKEQLTLVRGTAND